MANDLLRLAISLFFAAILTAAGFALQAQQRGTTAFSQSLYSNSEIVAHLGDDLRVNPSVPATVRIYSGFTEVFEQRATPGKPLFWRVLGDDQYTIRLIPDVDAVVTVTAHESVHSPLWSGLCFLLALGCVIAALPARREPSVAVKLHAREAVLWSVGALLLFVLIPAYFHNDAVGGGLVRNWGYRGWGYFDTMAASAHALFSGGPGALIGVQSFGKPILYPLIGGLLTGGRNTYLVGPYVSAVTMASAVFALFALLERRCGRLAARLGVLLLVLDPLIAAYATSYYQEIPWISAVLWSAYFLGRYVDSKRTRDLAIGLLLSALAAASKHPLTIALTLPITVALAAAQGATLRDCFRIAVYGVMIDVLAVLATWPFVWQWPQFRVPFILGARQIFDAVHHIEVPLWQRALNALALNGVQTTFLEVAALVAAIVAFLQRRTALLGWTLACFAITLLFTLPTSFYLQHYDLYAKPFVAIAGAIGIARVRARSYVLIGVVAVMGVVPLVAFWPYTAMATLPCLNPSCSLAIGFPGEPVYGLREAAAEVRTKARPRDVVLTFVAPHVLQAYLPDQQVLFVPSFPAKRRAAIVAALGARFVVATHFSDVLGIDPAASNLHLLRAFGDRANGARVYESKFGIARAALPDLEQSDVLARASAPRILFYDHGAAVRNGGDIIVIQHPELPAEGLFALENRREAAVVAPSHDGGYRVSYPTARQVHAVAEVRSDRITVYQTIGALLTSRPNAHVEDVGINIEGVNADTPLTAHAGCIFGQSTVATLVRNDRDAEEALISARDPIISACLEKGRGIFFDVAVPRTTNGVTIDAVEFDRP